jgi:hypothetical protein
MAFEEEAKRATICKLHLDMWMHQNTLMWSRLHTLWLVQVGFLALAHFLSQKPESLQFARWSCALCILTTFGLGIVMWTDRQLRNIHRQSIESFKLGLYPASTSEADFDKDFGRSFIEPAFHLSIFFTFLVIDFLAAYVFGLPTPWMVIFIMALAIAYFVALIYFYRKARHLETRAKTSAA